MKLFPFPLWPICLAIFCSCTETKTSSPNEVIPSRKSVAELKYADGFTITKDSLYTWVEVRKPFQGASEGFQYLLVPRHLPVPPHEANVRVVRTPLNSIVCTSTTHIPLLDYLDETDKLTGFPTLDFISSAKCRQRINSGKVTDLGVDKAMNIELLASLHPDLVMGYATSADYGQFKKMEELGIPVVINAEYLERHPLGRAEWIKFMAVFFEKEVKADSVFRAIESEYQNTKQKVAAQSTQKPTALSGILYGDAWFLPGGKNYAATILYDAGFNYLWQDDPSSGFLELSLEAVISKAGRCDYWVGVGSYQSLSEMAAAENRYQQFKAFQEKQVFSYDARRGEKGGNEYLELGYLRPDLILKDLVKISNPELLPGHQLFFHRRLN